MAVERRKGTAKTYKFRSVRNGKKVDKQYVGRLDDPAVELVHRTEVLKKASAKAATVARDAEFAQAKCAEVYLVSLAKLVARWKYIDRVWRLARAELPACRSHAPETDPLPIETVTRYLNVLPNQRTFRQLCQAAEKGDAAAQDQLRGLLASAPDAVSQIADLAAIAKSQFLDGIAEGSPLTREAVALKMETRATELVGYYGDNPLLHMLAETVVLCWFDLTRCQAALSRGAIGAKERKLWSDMADRAAKRFSNAADALRRARESVADGRPLYRSASAEAGAAN